MKNKNGKIGLIILGIIIFVSSIGIFLSQMSKSSTPKEKDVTYVYGAVGGGKENFMADKEINQILLDKYNIVVVPHDWSNGKLITEELTYELNAQEKYYDFVFFSDERFYEYYKTSAKENEAARLKILDSSIALNTPVVIYSWKDIATVLETENIVTQKDGVYYITDMNKLLNYITEGVSWSDIGLAEIYGKVNIASTDPVTSSPGATYYGLLASIMNAGSIDINNIDNVMERLNAFYKYSGFMNNTPADLFDLYLRMGKGAYPMIVDYEKSVIDFANNNPNGFEQVKDKMVILYPEPTIWNSHCIMSFSEAGNQYVNALNDPEIQKIAWEKYGFRTGVTGGEYDVESIEVTGIPQEITSVTKSLRKDVYDYIINYLRNN